MSTYYFICYSRADAGEFCLRLHDALQTGSPPIRAWIDQRDVKPGHDWDDQVLEAIRGCESLLFVMTRDSVESSSGCKPEWNRALRYKKPIIPVRLDTEAEMPLLLGNRQHIDFTEGFEVAIVELREHLKWLASPAGVLQATIDRLADAERDFRRARKPADQARIMADIELLKRQIAEQREVIENPQSAAMRVEERISRALERERRPDKPASSGAHSPFINPPPGFAPTYFQDRHVETKLVGEFLKNDSLRLMSVVGRGGVGKTAMVCRLLKALEGSQLPDDGGTLPVDGIVYLSATGSRRITVPNLFADLSKLLPDDIAHHLDAIYKNEANSTETKVRSLLAAFPQGRVVLLLDNFEDLLDPATRNLRDPELDEALRVLLGAPHHAIKVIITTRFATHDLALVQPARQTRLELDDGLPSPYAENILREMDADGKIGLKTERAELLDEARRRTRGYPRALEALFAILSADRSTDLPEVLKDAAQQLPENVVQALVGEAFNRLDATPQKVMQALAVYGRPVAPVAVDFLLQPFLPGVDSALVLNRLVNMQFVRKEAGRYYLHPVDSAYALNRIPHDESSDQPSAAGEKDYSSDSPIDIADGEDDQKLRDIVKPMSFNRLSLLRRAAEYFKKARRPRSEWNTIDDLAPQLAEFDLRCAIDDYETAEIILGEISPDYLARWGFCRLRVELAERLRPNLSDVKVARRNLSRLSSAHSDAGAIRESIKCDTEALTLAQETGEHWAEIVCLLSLSHSYNLCGGDQIILGIEYAEQALAKARTHKNRAQEADCLGFLGNCYASQGQVSLAVMRHEERLAICREIKDKDREFFAMFALSSWLIAVGQTERAVDGLEQFLAFTRETRNRMWEGACLNNLSQSYGMLGKTQRAIESCEQALSLAVEQGYRYGEGMRQQTLAELLIDQERYQEAIEHAAEGARIGNEIGSPDVANGNYEFLALAHLYSGDLSAARAAADLGRRHDDPMNNSNLLAVLGIIALRQEERRVASDAFTAAASDADRLVAHSAQNFSALYAKGLAFCGLALCEDKKYLLAARDAFRAARDVNRDPGVVRRLLQRFDALSLADRKQLLTEFRAELYHALQAPV